MSDESRVREDIREFFDNNPASEIKAVLGKADGTVKESGQNVYVTLYNGDVLIVHNDRVPRIPLRKIIIGLDGDSLLQVLRFDTVYDTHPTPNLPNHKDSHRWFDHDPIEVSKEQVMELLPRAIGGLFVRVYGGEYAIGTDTYILNNTDVDLSGEAVSTGAEWVNAEIDTSGVITFTHGSNVASRELLLPSDRAVRSSTKHWLFSVKMYAGQTDIIQTRTSTDIFDPRFTGLSSGLSGGVGGHTIIDEDGNTMPQQPKLQFDGADVAVSDSPGGLRTIVTITSDGVPSAVPGLARWAALLGEDTFPFPDIVTEIESVQINGLGQDPLTYSLSSLADAVILGSPLPSDAIVTANYFLEVFS